MFKEYSEDTLTQLFNEMVQSSFSDTHHRLRIHFRDIRGFGVANPYTNRVVINLSRVNYRQWSNSAVTGLLAHELSHFVSYHRRNALQRFMFVLQYPFTLEGKRLVEYEADEIAIQRGFGTNLIEKRIHQLRDHSGSRLKQIHKVYYSPAELLQLHTNNANTTS